MSRLVTNIRLAFRAMKRSPGFTLIAVLTLALGLGANAAIFSFIDGVLLKPSEFPESERLVYVWEKPPGGERNSISAADLLDWEAANKVFTGLSAISGTTLTMTGTGEPQLLRAETVSANYFDILRFRPLLGRTFSPGEDQPGKDNVVILSHRCWQSRFGGDPGIVGQTLTFDGLAYTVIGVLPEGSSFDRRRAEIWVPLSLKPQAQTRNFHWLNSIARLQPGVTLAQARSDMEAIAAGIAATYPDIKKGWSVTIDPYIDRLVGPQMRQSLYVLMTAVAGVLLICCVNLANLLLARGAGRSREFAIRAAIGASRGQIVSQLLVESLCLSFAGAIGGTGMGYGLLAAIRWLSPPFLLPAHANVQMDWRVFAFLFLLSAVAGILFGLAPALRLSRHSAGEALKEGGRGSAGSSRRGRLRGTLVITEVALAFVLLACAGLMIRSFQKLLNVQTGFDATNVITMQMPLSMEQNTDPERMDTYVRQVVEAVAALPGVRQAAVTSALPMEGWGYGMGFRISGHADADRARRPNCFFKIVTPAYFQALGIQVLKGRSLSTADSRGAVPAAVINQTMAQRYFPNEDPIGKQVLIEEIKTGRHELGPEVPWQVAGVVADERVESLDSRPSPGIYVPYSQSPIIGFGLVVRGEGDPERLVKSIQSQVWQINKSQALTEIRTMEQIKTESAGNSRLRTVLLGLFAGIALALAAIGIYGVLSYTTAQRTQELGIRAALGAKPADLVRLVLNSGMALAGVGLAIGLAGSLAMARLLSSLLFETDPYDPATLGSVLALLGAVAVAACLAPALRVTRIDPVRALRCE